MGAQHSVAQSTQCATAIKTKQGGIRCTSAQRKFLGMLGTGQCSTTRTCCSMYQCMFAECPCNAGKYIIPMVVPFAEKLGVQSMLDAKRVAAETKYKYVHIRLCEDHFKVYASALVHNAWRVWGEKAIAFLIKTFTKAAITMGDSSVDAEMLDLMFDQINYERTTAKEVGGGFERKRLGKRLRKIDF